MRILTAELKKTLTLRFFLILLVAIVANVLLFRNGIRYDFILYETDAYLAAQQDVMQVEDSQRSEYLEHQLQILEVFQKWETYDSLVGSGMVGTGYIDEEMRQYQDVYESGNYLKYTNNLYFERNLLQNLLEDVQQVSNYQQILALVIQEAKNKTEVSIFAEPGTFSYRSQVAMIDRFEHLKKVTPTYDISEGVLQALDSAATDLIALLMILLLCTQMVVTEHKNGMLPILRATRKGRFPLILSKVATAFALAFFVAWTLWGVNLLYCAGVFGLGDLSRPIHSLSGYAACTLEMSVGQYLCFFLMVKWLLYGTVGIACLIIGLVLRSAMPTWLVVGGVMGIEYILSEAITPISAWNILKYVNVGNLMFKTDWLAEYRNLNFFGYPVEVFIASCVLMGFLLIAGVISLCWVFCRRNDRTLPQFKIRRPGWLPRFGRTVSLLGHENWKLLIECGVIAVLILFLLINLQEPRTELNTVEELYYKKYMETLSGPLTQEKEEYLESEVLRFNDISVQISQLQNDCEAGKISKDDLEVLITPLNRALEARDILFDRILPQRDRILELQVKGEEAWFVYEKGYNYLFGVGSHEKAGATALLLAAVILCFANFFPLETSSCMQPLLNVYRKGRKRTVAVKFSLCALYTTLLFVMAQIPDYWYVIQNFGFSSLSAPLCSLEAFHIWGDTMPIWGGIVAFEVLRLAATLSLAMVVLSLSQWTGNQVITMSISAGVLLMPVLLHLLNINMLDAVSFYLPLTGSGLLCNQESLVKCLLYYGLTVAVGTACVLFSLRYKKRL